jgi:hypothetical protein
MLVAMALCFSGLSACASSTVPATSVPTISVPTLRPTPVPTATPLPLSTPQPIEAAVETVTRALQSNDATALAPLFGDQILVAEGPDGNIGGLVQRDDAIAWLTTRWGQQRAVESNEYIEHFVLLEITTQGWAKVAPLDNGRIIFHLHRYDAQGRGDALNGQWRIDAILYQ